MAAKDRGPASAAPAAGKLGGLGKSTAEVVRRASEVLEGELAAGIAAARKTQKRVQGERRVDAADLQEAVARFRADGHDLINAAREITAELRSESTDALTQRLLADTHDVLDVVLDFVTLAPDLVNRLARLTSAAAGSTEKPPREGVKKGAAEGKKAATKRLGRTNR